MITAESYPISPASIQTKITEYLSGLVPPGLIDSGICVVFAAATVILAALGHRHARSGVWCSGWCSGPLGIVTALVSASYATTGLPALAGVAPGDIDPRTIVVEVAVALAVAVLAAGAVWPVAMHVAAYRGRPVTLLELRAWVLAERLHAAGGVAAGALVAWAIDPLLCVAGAALGLGGTWLVEHLRGPAADRPESAGDARATAVTPAPVPEHRAAPPTPPISDEW